MDLTFLPKDIEDIIHKYQHQMQFDDTLKIIENSTYTIKEPRNYLTQSIRKINNRTTTHALVTNRRKKSRITTTYSQTSHGNIVWDERDSMGSPLVFIKKENGKFEFQHHLWGEN